MREPLSRAVDRADMIVSIGNDNEKNGQAGEWTADKPTFKAHLELDGPAPPPRAVLFCGIGRPHRFFKTASSCGVDAVEALSFPDHHRFTSDDLLHLEKLSIEQQAPLLTTEKDYVRLPAEMQEKCSVLKVKLIIEREEAFTNLLLSAVKAQ